MMFAAEVLERYAAGQRDFSGEVDFQRVNLPGVDLSNIRLVEPSLSGANLTNANLCNASLQYAHIDLYCNLAGSNMLDINLSKASICTANLSGVILDNADLSEAEIVDVNLAGASLKNASLRNTLLNCVDLTNTTLTETQISEAKMRGSSLVINKSKLDNTDLEMLNRLRCLAYGTSIFSSESDEENMSAFVWQIPGKTSLSIDDVIAMGKYTSNIDYKIKDSHYFYYPYIGGDLIANERYNNLLEIFRNELDDFKVYWLEETVNDFRTELDVYALGRTHDGSFAGVAVPHISWSLSDV